MSRQSELTERQCALTREHRPVNEMIRFVLAPDGTVVADLKRELPGRGVWITATRAAVAAGEKKRVFSRGFKADIRIEPGVADRVEDRLTALALGALGLARKAGAVVTGFSKVEAALEKDDIAALVHASDAAEDGIRKLAAIRVARFGPAGGPPVLRSFTSGQLDLALGRANVIHAAILAGRASRSFMACACALDRFRADSAANEPATDGS
ncbi:RNA-binding protein [Breoghania sp.]|uniref:RNA-binding protein n=1 Tax=Breoghania sp. TaxID=2065378 RepID=UPI002611419A|nr:RNA-binding protein [Breoghania sp.]MDJ0930868.1 RNA-binding protein [Breoghania sp.]